MSANKVTLKKGNFKYGRTRNKLLKIKEEKKNY